MAANWMGRWGAVFADAAYYVLGFSVWWLWLIGLRQWLSALARWLRGREPVQSSAEREAPLKPWQRWRDAAVGFWLSLTVLLAASTTLEWTRLYTLAERLPGDTGGVLGQILGPWLMNGLGFTGSALVSLVTRAAQAVAS